MSYVNYPIHIDAQFEDIFIIVHTFFGVASIVLLLITIVSTHLKSGSISSHYARCLSILESVLVLYAINSTIISIPFVLFPCKGFYVRGLGHYIGLSAHGGLVIYMLLFSGACTWFNCCMFYRHQVILPWEHRLKLGTRGIFMGYFIMNIVMFINPLSFIFTSKDDNEAQRSVVEKSPMAWLLTVPSYKIYTIENTPLMMTYHLPYAMTTAVLCTATTTFLTYHASYVMNISKTLESTRKERASHATVAAQQKLIRNIQFQMNITTFGTMFPTCYWLVAIFFQVILPEVTVGMHVFIPIAIMANSIYAIVSSKALSCKTIFRRQVDFTRTPTTVRTRLS